MYFHFKKFYIHKSVLYALLLIACVSGIRLYLTAMISIIFHELAHYITARLCGGRDMSIYIYPYGCRLHLCKNCRYEELIYLAGPLLSLLLATFGYFAWFEDFFNINLKIAQLNMLPALPLDGGMLIRVIIWKNYGIYYGTKISRLLTIAMALILAALAIIQKNIWLLTVSVLMMTGLKQKPVPFCIKKKYAKTKLFTIDKECTLLKVSRFLSSYYYTLLYVKSQGKYISENKFYEHVKKFGISGTISDIT